MILMEVRRSMLLCVCSGVGALYVRRRPRVRLEPLQNGGGQERGLRSGTVPTPLTVGLGAACRIAMQEMEVNKHSGTSQNPETMLPTIPGLNVSLSV